MADICELILEQHHDLRRRFAELDEYLVDRDADVDVDDLSRRWQELHRLLDAHAEAEETLFYPLLLRVAGGPADSDAADDTRDAIGDHNEIRDAAAATGAQQVGHPSGGRRCCGRASTTRPTWRRRSAAPSATRAPAWDARRAPRSR